jgi:hypothetical protein
MTTQDLLDKIAQLPQRRFDVPATPPIDWWPDSRIAAGVFFALKACRQWASAEAES